MSSPTSNLLSLTHKYRAQTVELIARQEALLSEQKAIFELERQLWATEREMWETERSLLLNTQLADNSQRDSSKITTIQTERTKKRQSSGGGGIGWFLKQGSQQQAQGYNDDVSPRDSCTPNQSERTSHIDNSSILRRQSLLSNEVAEEDEENIDDGDFSTIPPSLLAEASRLIYGDKPQAKQPVLIPQPPPPRARQMSSPLPGSARTTPKLVNTGSRIASPVPSSSTVSFASERSHSVSAGTAPSTNGVTTKPQRTKRGSHYLASFSENSSEDEDEDHRTLEIQIAEEIFMPKTPVNTAFTVPTRYHPPVQTAKKPPSPDNDDDKSDSSVPPLILRSSGNFGSAFNDLKKSVPLRKPPTNHTSSQSSTTHTYSTKGSDKRNSRMSTTNANNTSFYHPETPVENIISFGAKGWKTLEASGALKASHDNLNSAYHSAGQSTSSNIKSTELTLPSTWKGNTRPVTPGQPSPSVFPYPPEPIRPQSEQQRSSLSKRRSAGVSSVGSSSKNHSDSSSGNAGRNSRRTSKDAGSQKATSSPTESHPSSPRLSPSPEITEVATAESNEDVKTNTHNHKNNDHKNQGKDVTGSKENNSESASTSTTWNADQISTIPRPPPIPSTSSQSTNYPRISAVNPTGGDGTNRGIGLGLGMGMMSPKEQDTTKRWGGDIAAIGGMI